MAHESSSMEATLGVPDTRLSQVLEAAIARRIAGEDLSDEAVIEANPDLMPELGDMLLELRRVEAARRRAGGSSAPEAWGGRLEGRSLLVPTLRGYDILGEIHRGGQGVVFRAVQKSTRREVAIKVMRRGPFSESGERARFQREVEVLAQLKHPHIVTIHDSGVADGSHYFVMDYVAGEALDAYLARTQCAAGGPDATRGARPRIHDLLRLFLSICDAVSAAHLRGIIHRDLKPSNIRVDERGRPRVLDFGLAKLAGETPAEPSDASDVTIAGQFIGSVHWCSPEQAEGRPDKVDVRSDLYSLGVVLYQMLTRSLPYDVTGTTREVLDRVVRDPPALPRRVNTAIDDELETIMLKCLEKERERRYQTVGELARDIERYLSGEPIEAKRDNGWYVLRKTLRRYRVQTGLGAGFVLLVAAAAIALGVLYGDQKEQRKRAEEAERLAGRRLVDTTEALTIARRQTRKAEATTEFLREMLAAVDPNVAQGKEVTVREVLDAASARIEDKLSDEPDVAAAIHRTIGATYQALGRFEEAKSHFQQAVESGRAAQGGDHVDTLAAENGLATALESLNQFDEAEALYRACLEKAGRLKGEESLEAIDAAHNLGNLLLNRGRLSEAEQLLQEALSRSRRVLGDEHPSTLITRKVLAGMWSARGEYERAEPELRAVLEAQRRVAGEKSPNTLGTMNELARLLKAAGKLDAAAPLYEEIAELMNEVHGTEHPDTLRHMNSYGRLLAAQGRFAEAEAVYRRTLAAQTRRLTENHVDTIITTNNLSLCLSDQGRYAEAEPLARAALERGRAVLTEEHPDTLVWMNNLANLLSNQGMEAEAEELYRRTLELRRRVLTAEHPQTLTSMSNLANHLCERGALPEAEALAREVLAARSRLLGRTHHDTILSMNILLKVLLAAGHLDEAGRLGRDALSAAQATLPSGHSLTLTLMSNVALAHARRGETDEAIQLLGSAIDLADRHLPPTHVNRARLRGCLGEVYLDARRFDEAEPLLQTALQGIEQSVGPRHPATLKAARLLIEVHRARGASDKAADLHMRYPAASQPGE